MGSVIPNHFDRFPEHRCTELESAPPKTFAENWSDEAPNEGHPREWLRIHPEPGTVRRTRDGKKRAASSTRPLGLELPNPASNKNWIAATSSGPDSAGDRIVHEGVGEEGLCLGIALGGKVPTARLAASDCSPAPSASTGELHVREVATDTGRSRWESRAAEVQPRRRGILVGPVARPAAAHRQAARPVVAHRRVAPAAVVHRQVARAAAAARAAGRRAADRPRAAQQLAEVPVAVALRPAEALAQVAVGAGEVPEGPATRVRAKAAASTMVRKS